MTNVSAVKAAGAAAGREVVPVEELYLKYQEPLRVHLRGKFRSFPLILNHSEDLLQDFAKDKILAEGWLRRWDQRKGRFRDFLRTSLNNFVWDWWRRQPEYQGRKERENEQSATQGRSVGLSPDMPPSEPDPEQFNFSWAQTVIAETLDRVEQTCKDPNRRQPESRHVWEIFRLRTLDPIFQDTEPTPYEELVKTFGLRSPSEGTNMLLSAKRMFKRLLEDVISEYSGSDRATKSELRVLIEFVETLAKRNVKNKPRVSKQ